MALLDRFEVLPLQAQISIRDPASADYPQWETGEEHAVATDQCIAVATQGDANGRVVVEVAVNEDPIDGQWLLAFDGDLLLTGDEVLVGNYLAGDEHAVPIGRGWRPVQVFTSPHNIPPKRILIVFGREAL
jgi:hypothetical protein